MRTVHLSACPLDCPDTCSIAVTVEDGRVVGVDAAPVDVALNSLTAGWICKKVKHSDRRVHSAERVMTPLVRRGDKASGPLVPVGWDEALDLVATRIRDAIDLDGPDAVAPYLYNSSTGVLASSALTPQLFARLGCPDISHTICAATAGAAWRQVFGTMLSADPLDVEHARLIVVWGANPTVSNTHLLPVVNRARAGGATLVVIDPRRTGIATRADLHLPVRPGTDAALGLALAHLLAEHDGVDRAFVAEHASGVDEYLAAADGWTPGRAAAVCGVAAGDIERLAELVGSVRPAMLRIGWGLERNRAGASGIIAALALWVLAGHFGRQGSGIVQSTSKAAPVDPARLWPPGVPRRERSSVNMNHVGAWLCGELPDRRPPRVLFVQGSNPAVTAVDQLTMLRGLAREDLFTVVHEQVMTDTACLADVVLPATTHFEADDVATSYGSFTLQALPALIERVGESRTNDELAAALATRLGFDAAEFDPEPGALLGRVLTGAPGRVRAAGATVQFVDTLPSHPDGRACLFAPESAVPVPRVEEPPGDDPHPLTLLTPASNRTVNSIFAEFDPPEVAVTMSPADAATRGVVDGQRVRVHDGRAAITLTARVDPAMREGVCAIPKGLWRRHLPEGLTANAFAPASIDPLAGGACFNDARVEVVWAE